MRLWRNWSPRALLVGVRQGAAVARNSVAVPQKVKNRTAVWPSSPSPGHSSRRTETRILQTPHSSRDEETPSACWRLSG